MHDLRGKTIAVLGGSGAVGGAIAGALREAGAHVIATSLADGDLATEAGVEAHFGKIAHAGGVIVAIGGWRQGPPLLQLPAEEWDAILASHLRAHFLVARRFLPGVAARGGFYFLINGGTSERPAAGAGPVSIAAAAQAMLAQVLRLENPEARILEIVIHSPVVTAAWRGDVRPEWLTGPEVGAWVARLAASEVSGVRHLRTRQDVTE